MNKKSTSSILSPCEDNVVWPPKLAKYLKNQILPK